MLCSYICYYDSVCVHFKTFISPKMSTLINVLVNQEFQATTHTHTHTNCVTFQQIAILEKKRLVTKHNNSKNHLDQIFARHCWIVIQLRRNLIETWHNTIVINGMFLLYIKTSMKKIIWRTRFIWIRLNHDKRDI